MFWDFHFDFLKGRKKKFQQEQNRGEKEIVTE